MAVSILVNIFTTRILLQALGASDYGLYNVVGGAITMLGFLTASMTGATQRFISYAEGEGNSTKIKEILANSLIVHHGLAAITVLLLTVAGFLFFNGILNIPYGKETDAIIVYVCMVASTAFSITVVPYDALLNAHENMRFYSITGIIDVLLKFLIAILIYYSNSEQLILYGILMAVEAWSIRAITQYYCKKKYDECENIAILKYRSNKIIKRITSFAGWNLIESASNMLSFYGMSIVVNHYFGTELNAALGITIQLSGVLMGASLNMINAITPIIVKEEGGKQRNRMLAISNIGCKFSYILLSMLCYPIIFYIDYILEIWLHEVPKQTGIFCQIFIISNLIEQLTRLLYQTIMAQGDIKQYNMVRSITNVIPICISIIMFEHGGYSPAWILINWLIWRAFIGGIINMYYAHINVGLSIKLFLKQVIFICTLITIAVVIFNYALLYIYSIFPINKLCYFLISALLSLPIYWFVGLTQNERCSIYAFAKNAIFRNK